MAMPVLVMEYSVARDALKRPPQPLQVPWGRVQEKQEQDGGLRKIGSCREGSYSW